MVACSEQMVQRHCTFAVVDEVDSILVDEVSKAADYSGQAEVNCLLILGQTTSLKA